MRRLILLLLLLVNLVYFAWARAWFAPLGFAPATDSEPRRLSNQIRPEAIRILSAEETKRVETALAVTKSSDCLQAGLFDAAQVNTLRQGLSTALAPESWSLVSSGEPGRWVVYMGPFGNNELLAKKRAELRNMHVTFGTPPSPALEPGLSLGIFESRAEAERELTRLSGRGVRTARVVQDRPEVQGFLLRLPAVDDHVRARIEENKSLLAGKPLVPCRP